MPLYRYGYDNNNNNNDDDGKKDEEEEDIVVVTSEYEEESSTTTSHSEESSSSSGLPDARSFVSSDESSLLPEEASLDDDDDDQASSKMSSSLDDEGEQEADRRRIQNISNHNLNNNNSSNHSNSSSESAVVVVSEESSLQQHDELPMDSQHTMNSSASSSLRMGTVTMPPWMTTRMQQQHPQQRMDISQMSSSGPSLHTLLVYRLEQQQQQQLRNSGDSSDTTTTASSVIAGMLFQTSKHKNEKNTATASTTVSMPLCLAKYERRTSTTSTTTASTSTTTTTTTITDDSSRIVAAIIQSIPPVVVKKRSSFHNSGKAAVSINTKQRLTGFKVQDMMMVRTPSNGNNGNSYNHKKERVVVYGAESSSSSSSSTNSTTTSKSYNNNKPICCAVVTDRDYPYDTAIELLQETYKEFMQISANNSFIRQRHETPEYALSYPAKAILQSLMEKYQDPNAVIQQNQQQLDASQVLKESRRRRQRPRSLLGGSSTSTSSGDEREMSSDDDERLAAVKAAVEQLQEEERLAVAKAALEERQNAKPTAPWMQQQQHKQKLRPTMERTKSQQELEVEMIDTVIQHESSEDDDDDLDERSKRRSTLQRTDQQPIPVRRKASNEKESTDRQTSQASDTVPATRVSTADGQSETQDDPKLVERKDSKIEVVVNVPWDSRPEWMTKKTSFRSVAIRDDPTITTHTNTTAAGMTTINGDQNGNVAVNQPIPATLRSILLQQNKNSSNPSTLGGSLNGEGEYELDDSNHEKDSSTAKAIPIWAKARENLRSTPKVERPKKHSSVPISTKEDLRPTPQVEKEVPIRIMPLSPDVLKGTPKQVSKKGFSASGNLPSPPPPSPPPQQPPSLSITGESEKSSIGRDEPFWKKLASINRAPPRASPEIPVKKIKALQVPSDDTSATKQSPSKTQIASVNKSPGRKPDMADALLVPVARAMSNMEKQKPINVETTANQRIAAAEVMARKPTISRYDNWELVKAHYLPSMDPHSVDESTLTNGDTSLDNDGISSSATSDWGAPTRNQNADDSSWVNPTRPVDAERRERIKTEVDRTFLNRLEQARFKSLGSKGLKEEQVMPIINETKRARPDPTSQDEIQKARLLAAAMAVQPGSYNEEQGWVPIVKSAPQKSSGPNETAAFDNSETWNVPIKVPETQAIFRKAGEETKDYRYTYITARPVSSQQNAPSLTTSYWDKVRQNYFEDRDVPILTEGPPTSSFDSTARPSWMDGGDQSIESGSWLPPSGINPSVRETTRSIPIGADPLPPPRRQVSRETPPIQREYNPSYSSYPTDPGSGDKSVVTSDSDWQPPGRSTRTHHRVDFTGRVTSTKKDEQQDSDSCGSGDFPWVPTPEDLSFLHNDDMKYGELSTGLPGYPSQASAPERHYTNSSSSNNESGWDTGSEYSVEDVASSVWTSDLKLEGDDDYNMDQNISGHSIDFVKEEEAAALRAVKFELAEVERQHQEKRQRRQKAIPRTVTPPLPSIARGIIRTASNDSSSMDSVLSYTGRIAFKTTPEIITFVDHPDEDRGGGSGRHHSRHGRISTNLSRANNDGSGYKSMRGRPDPCIYYTLCCVMLAIPAAILVVMFVFVIDLDGNDGTN